MNYADLIKDAFWITLRNRFLWVFGFFAGSGAGGASFSLNSPPSSPGGGFEDEDAEMMNDALPLVVQELQQWVYDNLALIVTVGAGVLLILLSFFALGVLSGGALTESVAALSRGEERRFSSTFRAGLSSFWRVLGLSAVFFLIWAGLLLVIGGPVVLLFVTTSTGSVMSQAFAAFGALFIAALLVAVVFIPVGIIGQFALRALVIGGERIFASVASGYRLFRQYLGRSLLVWLIYTALSIGSGIVLGIASLIVFLVLALPAIILLVAGSSTGTIVASAVALPIWLILIVVALAALSTFYHSYWTLAYLRLSAGETASTGEA